MHPIPAVNATDILRHDHRKLKYLFDVFAESDGAAEQQDLVESIIREFRLHTQLEEQVFYPALREAALAVPLIDQAQEEHQEIIAVMDDLQDLALEDPLFQDKFMELEDKAYHHMQLEESELFPLAETASLDLESLGDQLRQTRRSLMTPGVSDENAPVPKRLRKKSRPAGAIQKT